MSPPPPYTGQLPFDIHQSTKTSTDSASIGPVHVDIELRRVLDIAKNKNTDKLRLFDLTQSGPGKTRIDELTLDMTLSKVCPMGHLLSLNTYDCIPHHPTQHISCGPGTYLKNNKCFPSNTGMTCGVGTIAEKGECVPLKRFCDHGYVLKEFVCRHAHADTSDSMVHT